MGTLHHTYHISTASHQSNVSCLQLVILSASYSHNLCMSQHIQPLAPSNLMAESEQDQLICHKLDFARMLPHHAMKDHGHVIYALFANLCPVMHNNSLH